MLSAKKKLEAKRKRQEKKNAKKAAKRTAVEMVKVTRDTNIYYRYLFH